MHTVLSNYHRSLKYEKTRIGRLGIYVLIVCLQYRIRLRPRRIQSRQQAGRSRGSLKQALIKMELAANAILCRQSIIKPTTSNLFLKIYKPSQIRSNAADEPALPVQSMKVHL